MWSSDGTVPRVYHLETERARRPNARKSALTGRGEDESRTLPLLDIQPTLNILCHADERRVSSLLLYFELQHYVDYNRTLQAEVFERT